MSEYRTIRGMHDLLPRDLSIWQWLEQKLKTIAQQYGYREIRFPIVESLGLFQRTIGAVTDIVEKEMYQFTDRGGELLALRPEGTASCVRAGIQHGLLHNQQQKFWYMGPMFRYERPQKGRCRQFHHFGLEAFGYLGSYIDVELITLVTRLWQALGVQAHVELKINSLGTKSARTAYRNCLVQYYQQHYQQLDADSQKRLLTNPLRILDSKHPETKLINCQAPKLIDFLDGASKDHFDMVKHLLDKLSISYVLDPYLVRGLDYYNDTVFEWVTTQIGAQDAVCGGGHYDTLVEELGGSKTQAIGLAIGLERLVLLLKQAQTMVPSGAPDIYLACLDESVYSNALELAEKLRDNLPKCQILTDLILSKAKNIMKRADKSEAKLAVILDKEVLTDQKVELKFMRCDKPSEKISIDELLVSLKQGLGL